MELGYYASLNPYTSPYTWPFLLITVKEFKKLITRGFVQSTKDLVQFSHSSRVRLFVTLRTTTRQASLSITNSQSPPKPMSIESVMPSIHLILCRPLLLLPSIFPSIRVFPNESSLHNQVAKILELQLQHQSFQ